MKTKDGFSRCDLLCLRRQSTALLLVNLFLKTICSNHRIKSPRKAAVVAALLTGRWLATQSHHRRCGTYAISTVLAAILALSILGAGPAQAGEIPGTIHGTVTVPSVDFPSPQVANGTLNVGTSGDNAILNIQTGGAVTVGTANLGQGSADAKGTVNVIGPDATFTSMPSNGNGPEDIVVGAGGTGVLNVQSNGIVQSAGSIFIGDPNNEKGTGTVTALGGARIVSQTNGITVVGTGVVNIDNSTLIASTGDAFLVGDGKTAATATISINNVNNTIHAGSGGFLLRLLKEQPQA